MKGTVIAAILKLGFFLANSLIEMSAKLMRFTVYDVSEFSKNKC